MLDQYNIHQAKTHLSAILAEIQKTGKEVIISKAGEPIGKLVPYNATSEMPKKRELGRLKGQAWISDDFFTCDEEIANEFLNSRIFPDEK